MMLKFSKFNLFLVLVIVIIPFRLSYGQFLDNNEGNLIIRDSLIAFKSDTLTIYKLSKSGIESSRVTPMTGYHIFNFSTNKVTLNLFNSKTNKRESKTIEYYSASQTKETIEFNPDPNICRKIYLDTNPYNSIIYSFVNNDELFVFSNAKKIDNGSLGKLDVYKWIDSYDIENLKLKKEIVIKEKIKGFEYSDFWRKESYKKVINFMETRMATNNCKIISRGYYSPNIVRYIGNQGYAVKYYCEFDCDQDYINQSYFWIEAYYLGYGKWDLKIVDQQLTH